MQVQLQGKLVLEKIRIDLAERFEGRFGDILNTFPGKIRSYFWGSLRYSPGNLCSREGQEGRRAPEASPRRRAPERSTRER
eukprot:2979894-Pleurochrysis_carterae.AAC.1